MDRASAYPGHKVRTVAHTADNGVIWEAWRTGYIVDVFPGIAVVKLDGGWTHLDGKIYHEFGFDYRYIEPIEEEGNG